jgi:opacity protein-like surface antigen/outer membrane protease
VKKLLLGSVALVAVSLAGQVHAADIPVKAVPYVAPWSWNGSYVGIHAGAALGFSNVSDPYGTSIYGDKIRTPGFLLGLQVGHNWQAPGSNFVWGVEGDLSWLDAEGTNTCFATTAPVGILGPGMITSSNCRARPDFTGTLTGRIGLATGTAGRTLLYVKGGAAVLHNRLDATTNWGFGVFPITTTSASPTTWGWTIGAGVEQAVSPAWSVKLEYDYLDFGSANLTTPATFTTTPTGFFTAVPSTTASVRQDMHQMKIGLNYKIGADPWAQFGSANTPLTSAPRLTSGWVFETGGRYWYSSGRFQKDLPSGATSSTSLISRLTYDDLTGHSGELFARLDTPINVFLKGFIGGGKISGGKMNDEDWGLITGPTATAYSNTLSNLTSTKMNYVTIDAGYDFLRGPGYKVGAFVGYNHVYEQYAANDCNQIAMPTSGICSPMISGVPVITETDKWNSMRVGMATDTWLTPQLRLVSDIAYLPYVKFTGVDNHWLRNLVIDESGTGHGVQLEAILSYYVTPQFSLGVGGRYWAMWTRTGSDAFNGVPINRTDTYRYERYGMLLQAAYKFN